MKTTSHRGNTITAQDGVEIYYKGWGPPRRAAARFPRHRIVALSPP